MNIEEIKARWEKQYRCLDPEFGVVLDLDAVWRDIGDLIERVEKLEKVAEAAKSAIRCDLWGTYECSYECQGKNQSVCLALAALGADDD